MKYLLILQVSIYCLLALHCSLGLHVGEVVNDTANLKTGVFMVAQRHPALTNKDQWDAWDLKQMKRTIICRGDSLFSVEIKTAVRDRGDRKEHNQELIGNRQRWAYCSLSELYLVVCVLFFGEERKTTGRAERWLNVAAYYWQVRGPMLVSCWLLNICDDGPAENQYLVNVSY